MTADNPDFDRPGETLSGRVATCFLQVLGDQITRPSWCGRLLRYGNSNGASNSQMTVAYPNNCSLW